MTAHFCCIGLGAFVKLLEVFSEKRSGWQEGWFLKNAKKYEKKLKFFGKPPIIPSNRTEV
jgi:hypothetical protein